MKDIAIAVYIDNDINIITEFGWLYKSWMFSGSWRTSDIVAFHNPAISYDDLPRDNSITYIPLAPYTERSTGWEGYPYINSIEYLTMPEASVLMKYKHVLRTDCDCFLTPYFPGLKPRLTRFGAGMFASDTDVVIRLAEISKRWSIPYIYNNIGSTFISDSGNVLHYSQIQMEYCRKLKADEFKDGQGTWPGWYYGVLTMYAGQLAASSVFGYNMIMGGLDAHCMASDPMSPQDYHIHAWHTYQYFSKHSWRAGEYKNYDMDTLDKNIINDYCLWIAGPGPEVVK